LRITDFVQSRRLLEKRDRLLIGVSGGPDSVFLLYYLSSLRSSYKLNLLVAHFNHALRPEADEEEGFVKKLSQRLGLHFVSEKRNVAKLYQGDSWENIARKLRFDFFLKLCRHYRIKKIALAHHKDDLVETVLLNLIRGTGLLGLRGIMPLSPYQKIAIIRPLLFLEKKEILSYLKRNEIKFRLDSSNQEEKFLRNKIRLKLLPLLRQYNPAIKDNLYHLARIVSADYDFLVSQAEKAAVSLQMPAPGGLRLKLEGLTKLPPALLFLVLRLSIEKVKGHLRRLELRHLEKIKDLIFNSSSATVLDIPGLKIIKEEKALYLKYLSSSL